MSSIYLSHFVLSQCNQSLYLLKLSRTKVFSAAQLDYVSQALIVPGLRDALHAWSRFLPANLINRIRLGRQFINVTISGCRAHFKSELRRNARK